MIKLFQRLFNALKCVFDFERITNTINYYKTKRENRLLFNVWVKTKKGLLVHNNWGDDINYYLFQELSSKNIFNLSNMVHYFIPYNNYNILAIGSIIEMRCRENSVIWGSGMMNGICKLKVKPYKVLAVRGPLTRMLLMKKGIECPEIYGDPALLLPLYYQPSVKKKYKVGIIPHYNDLDNIYVSEFLQKYKNDSILINLRDYTHWRDIPERINECEMILSSSLHGLIVSDAYNIPNVWVSFSDKIVGGNFKYLDYFKSVARTTEKPWCINGSIEYNDILRFIKHWSPITFNPEPLIRCCPFKLNYIDKFSKI